MFRFEGPTGAFLGWNGGQDEDASINYNAIIRVPDHCKGCTNGTIEATRGAGGLYLNASWEDRYVAFDHEGVQLGGSAIRSRYHEGAGCGDDPD